MSNTTYIKIANILITIWIISWFTAIWVEEYKTQIFLTGLFCFTLVFLIAGATSKEKTHE